MKQSKLGLYHNEKTTEAEEAVQTLAKIKRCDKAVYTKSGNKQNSKKNAE